MLDKVFTWKITFVGQLLNVDASSWMQAKLDEHGLSFKFTDKELQAVYFYGLKSARMRGGRLDLLAAPFKPKIVTLTENEKKIYRELIEICLKNHPKS